MKEALEKRRVKEHVGEDLVRSKILRINRPESAMIGDCILTIKCQLGYPGQYVQNNMIGGLAKRRVKEHVGEDLVRSKILRINRPESAMIGDCILTIKCQLGYPGQYVQNNKIFDNGGKSFRSRVSEIAHRGQN